MNMKHISGFLVSALLLLSVSLGAADKTYTLQSPSGNLKVQVTAGSQASWAVEAYGTSVLEPSVISMTLDDGTVLGADMKVKKAVRRSVDHFVTPEVYRREKVKEAFNELTLRSKGYSIVFRAYDDGAAYRFVADRKASFNVSGEQASFRFGSDYKAFVPYVRNRGTTFESQFFNSFESTYTQTEISRWEKGRIAFLPVTLDGPEGMKVCITESGLLNYPGMFLYNDDGDTALEGVFAPYPKEIEQGGHNMLQGLVKSRESYIAKAGPKEEFPWRIVVVAKEDKDLLLCDLPWLLGAEPEPGRDFSWVRPGKVAWDWWNAWNVYGVDFRAGINNDTYKYYIDFASRNGIEYVILDEGWAVTKKADLFQVVPEIDLPELCKYAEGKGVGLILWAGYWAFERDMERACREYSAMGVKGFKVDFMDRDDQKMVEFYRRTAETAARYHLMIDFHGAFKPAGLQRTWPNVVNMEGVYGLENAKWGKESELDLVTYEVSIPFVRLVAGPADYTQGAMRNATRGNYRPVNSEAMSQGTRCRQLSQYVIFDAPLTMLCDSPSNYLAEPECLKYIAGVPTVWDESVPLAGKAGEYVAVARRKGSTWYVGAMTDWNARELTLDLSFIGGPATMECFADGVNADRAARDYRHTWAAFPADGKVSVKMAPGGGWAAVIRTEPEPCQCTEALKVMSFNIRNAGAQDGDNAWPLRADAVKLMLESELPDVFGIQEAYPEQEVFILENCPGYKGFGVGRDDGADKGERMSVFYRTEALELLDGGTWWLSETPDVPSVGWDAKYPRTATWAKLRRKSDGREFFFVNTHLDHKGVKARREGLAFVVDKVSEMSPGTPLILTGDFNVEPGDDCLLSLEGKMKDARTEAPVSCDRPSFNGFGKSRGKLIDYIYYRGFSAADKFCVVDGRFLGKSYISDHYPITATLRF